MAYNTKYQASFESTAQQEYTVYILEDGYVGAVIPITLAGVKQSWQTDEPQPAIKGSSLTVSVYNTGSLPITSFYSNNDNQFKVWFYRGGIKLFEGYLVQDDCHELMVDYMHEIVLSFTDNLGLLKDVPLNQTLPNWGGYLTTAYFDFLSPNPTNNCFIYLYNTDYIPVVATPFTISGHISSAANAAWTPTVVTNIGNGNWKVQVADFSFTDMQAWACYISGTSTIDLYHRNTLLNIIRLCVSNTGIDLNVHIYANILENSHDVTRSFLEQTYIDAQTFINGDNFIDCYQALEIILNRFNLTLFQANGVWNIMRWQDLRYYYPGFAIPYFIYNSAFEYTGTGTFNKTYTTGFNEATYPETGLERSIIRPYKFVKETFNYVQPKYLLNNFDLLRVGALRTSYASGSDTIYEYDMPDWQAVGAFLHTFYIRVVIDSSGTETERYAVVLAGTPSATAIAVQGNPFEVSAGDKITLEYTLRTTKSQAGSLTNILGIKLYDGTTTNYADDNKSVNWKTTLGWNNTIASGDNSNVEHTVTLDPGQIPFDGLIYIYLPQTCFSTSSSDETHIKDIRLTYQPFINASTKIIGQIHSSEQDVVIKNNLANDISTDDSPRNSIAGTLFKPSFTSLIQDKTVSWKRSVATETKRIGEIITFEKERWRQIPRTKMEGTFYGLVQTNDISMLSILTNTSIPFYNFIFGMLEIDYKNNSFTGTQYEMYLNNEEMSVWVANDYTFTYIYNTK